MCIFQQKQLGKGIEMGIFGWFGESNDIFFYQTCDFMYIS